MSDNSNIDEDDIDTLIGRKKSPNDDEVVSTLAHAPFFPLVIHFQSFLYQDNKPRWWAFLADPRGNRIIVHPSMIMDIGISPRKWRVQFQAPPQIATYMFNLHIKSDSYCGTDIIQKVLLEVQDVSELEEIIVEEVIPESEEGMSPGLSWLIC